MTATQDPPTRTPSKGRPEEGLARGIGTTGVAMIALNGIIGAGIFGVPAGAAALAGAWSPLVFVACALLLAAIMLCFAEISSRFTRTGGPIVYVGEAFGRFAGFQTGWAFFIARVTSFAANISLLLASLAWFWPAADSGPTRVALLALFIGGLTWINVAGVRGAVRLLGGLTVLKLLPLLALVAFGLGWLDESVEAWIAAPAPGIADFGTAALLVVYAFVGWESALIPAGETRDPARAMPRALLGALAVATVLYVTIQMISVAALPGLAESDAALVDVAAVLMGPTGAVLLTAGVVISVTGNLAASMISSPRMTFAMARDGDLPAWLGRVHPQHRTPANAIIATSVIVFVLSVFGSFLWLAAMSALVRVLIYMGCIAAMPRLRRKASDLDAPGFELRGGWTIPVVALLASGLLLIQLSWQSLAATVAVVAAGSVIFLLMHRRAHASD